MSPRFDQLTTAAEVIGDFLAAAAGVIGAYTTYRVLGLGKAVLYPFPLVIWAASAFALLFVIMLDREGVYRRGSGMLRISESERTLRVSAQTFLMLLVVTAFSAHLLSRWVLAIGIFLVPTTVVVEKQLLFSIVRYLHARGQGVRKAIIYGSGYTGKRVFSVLLRSRKLGINPLVFVDDKEEQVGKTIYALAYHREQCASVVSGPITSQLIESYGANMIIVAIPSLQPEKFFSVAAEARKSGVTLAFVPSSSAYEDAWVNYLDVDGIMLATVNPPESMYLYERTKRLSDLVLSLGALVLLSPIFALIALATRERWSAARPAPGPGAGPRTGRGGARRRRCPGPAGRAAGGPSRRRPRPTPGRPARTPGHRVEVQEVGRGLGHQADQGPGLGRGRPRGRPPPTVDRAALAGPVPWRAHSSDDLPSRCGP